MFRSVFLRKNLNLEKIYFVVAQGGGLQQKIMNVDEITYTNEDMSAKIFGGHHEGYFVGQLL